MTHVVPRILNDVLSATCKRSCELFFMAGAVFGVDNYSCCYAHCK